ncbi:MAG: branched-chain amino acid ABC transporter [Rhizobiales bacterium 62-17]|nr:ABC transporter substrate-binding protein [Hyphomicrobiales bacterium]OJX99839.1 MAG: branched-chain amino acid ABC transporter [Rhizobiales bacterium 62-17]
MLIDRSKFSRRTVLAGTAAGTAVLATPSILRAQAQTLKIAVLLPRSGYLAQAGQSCHRGALVSAPVLADLGYKVEMVHIDIESNPDVARTQAERAINEGAHCIVGAFDSAGTLAIAQVCEQRQVPLIVNIAAAPQLTEQGYKFLVRNFPTGQMLVSGGLQQLKTLISATKVEPKTAVFLHANDTFGMAQRQGMDKLFPAANMPFKLVESIAYDPKAQDLSVEVTKMRSLNPDVLLVVTRAADAIKLIRDVVRQKFQPMAILSPGSPGLYDEEFFKALGPLADFCAYALPWANPKSKSSQALEAAFKKMQPDFRFPIECFNVGFTFDALLTAADAFKRAGSTNGVELMKALKSTNLVDHAMIGPPITFDEKGQNNNIPAAVVQNRGRVPTVVLPADVATMTPVLPAPPWQGRT